MKVENNAALEEYKRIIKIFGASESSFDVAERERIILAIKDGRIIVNEDETIDVVLKTPIKMENTTIPEIKLQEPTTTDLEKIDKIDRTQGVLADKKLIEIMTKQPIGVIGHIKSRDFALINQLIKLFF